MLILASSSPRRQELLRNAGVLFRVQPADIAEDLQEGENPTCFAERLAREKAAAVAGNLKIAHPIDQDESFTVVLGADTVVVVDEHVLGKPADAADAARMLRLLSDRAHEVTTGVCLMGRDFVDVRSETTRVSFGAMTEDEIRCYAASGEPMDKAGAYGIQGLASRWIPRIDGDYFNVVGLPVSLVWRMLREHGVV